MGLIVLLDLIWGPKCCIMSKYYKFRAINGKSRSKMPPEVADGSHGGPGRGQEVENGLEDGESF